LTGQSDMMKLGREFSPLFEQLWSCMSQKIVNITAERRSGVKHCIQVKCNRPTRSGDMSEVRWKSATRNCQLYTAIAFKLNELWDIARISKISVS
jgi:hypothetical protein